MRFEDLEHRTKMHNSVLGWTRILLPEIEIVHQFESSIYKTVSIHQRSELQKSPHVNCYSPCSTFRQRKVVSTIR
jgi:hypothetical protein